MREKFKYLFKNTGYLLIGNFSSKILVFLLVPLYTSVLSTAEYGTYDLTFTTIQLLMPVLSLNIIDGVMRFSIDAGAKERQYTFYTAMKYMLLACMVFLSGAIVVRVLFQIDVLEHYFVEIILFFAFYMFSQFAIQFARGLDDIKGISISGILGTATVIISNVLFLLVWKIGLRGYFWANICSFGIQGLFLASHSRFYMYYLSPKEFGVEGRKYGKEILLYCWPLVFNTLSWYINGAADRYAVTYFNGIKINGIYSIAYKIPAVLNAVQTIFIQAWQLSAIREYETSDSAIFYRKTYQSVQLTMILLCSALIMSTRILAKLLFSADFYAAWKFVPTLLLYVVFNTLSGTVGGIFSAAKDSKAFSVSAITGASINILLNIILVYIWGAEGAAIATVISSIVIWYMRMHFARKYVSLKLKHIFYSIEYLILFLQVALMTIIKDNWGYFFQIVIFLVLLFMNIVEVKDIFGEKRNEKRQSIR